MFLLHRAGDLVYKVSSPMPRDMATAGPHKGREPRRGTTSPDGGPERDARHSWNELLCDRGRCGKWLALSDCVYADDRLFSCLVVDEDYDISALEERIARQEIRSCLIAYCGEEPECHETPRVTRTTIVDLAK